MIYYEKKEVNNIGGIMSEYINEDILNNEGFKKMQAIAEEVRKWPEWKLNLSGIDNYSQNQMETETNTEDQPE